MPVLHFSSNGALLQNVCKQAWYKGYILSPHKYIYVITGCTDMSCLSQYWHWYWDAPLVNFSEVIILTGLICRNKQTVTLLVMDTKRHYHGYLDKIDGGPLPLPDVTEAEMLVFLAITIQLRHCIWTNWQTAVQITNQFHTRFYISAINSSDTFISFACCILHTTIICLTGRKEIVTGYGRCEICLKL
jgi:hypothetical protein